MPLKQNHQSSAVNSSTCRVGPVVRVIAIYPHLWPVEERFVRVVAAGRIMPLATGVRIIPHHSFEPIVLVAANAATTIIPKSKSRKPLMNTFYIAKRAVLFVCLLVGIGSVTQGQLLEPKSRTGHSRERGSHDLFGSRQSDSGPSLYFSTDYLLWQTSGMDLPALVTGSPLGTPVGDAGVLGLTTTNVLAGGEEVFEGVRSGLRLNSGIELTDRFSIDGEYFWLSDEELNYGFDGTANQILARPFMSLEAPLGNESQVTHFPPNIDGSIDVHAYSQFRGGAVRGVFQLGRRTDRSCQVPTASCDAGCDAMMSSSIATVNHAFSLSLGYRQLSLDEGVRINEQLVNPINQFDIVDQFDTTSRFHGIEFGLNYACQREHLGFDVFGQLAIGNNHNAVRINGQTLIDNVPAGSAGGILAQPSNIGLQEDNSAALAAHFGFNLNARLFSNLTASIGYSGMFWGDVVRAGEQIDLNVHPGLFAPATAPAGTTGARPTGAQDNYFAHGLNVGLTARF